MKFVTASSFLVLSLLYGSNTVVVNGQKSKNDPTQVFSRAYVTIIEQADFTTILPDFSPTNAKTTVVGQAQFQSGGIYDPAEIKLEKRTAKGKGVQDDVKGQQFAGGEQPANIPEESSGFNLRGECIATAYNSQGNPAQDFGIAAHSCTLDLCLGGGGFDCMALYCGTAFNFFPTSLNPSNTLINQPKLPPSYPCTIFGGTNAFFGIRGTADITTLTGSTTPRISPQKGFIVQQINVISNIALPPAP